MGAYQCYHLNKNLLDYPQAHNIGHNVMIVIIAIFHMNVHQG